MNALIASIPPGVLVAALGILICSQVFYAVLPYRRRAYLPALLLTAAGFGLGQLWDYIGLPGLRLGQANLVPAVAFALLLQPLARFVVLPARRPKEPKVPSKP